MNVNKIDIKIVCISREREREKKVRNNNQRALTMRKKANKKNCTLKFSSIETESLCLTSKSWQRTGN